MISPGNRHYHQHMYWVLKDWYGVERARTEMAGYCPESQPISDLLDEVMRKALPPEELVMFKVKEHWLEIAGAELARICLPIGIKDEGVMEVTVSHPAWLRELRGPVKQALIDNVNRYCGEGFCRDIRFVPSGR